MAEPDGPVHDSNCYEGGEDDIWSWGPNFTPEEFACTHCGKIRVHVDTMDLACELRDLYGKPIIVESGHRCPDHPIEAAKPGRRGAHVMGTGFDARIPEDDGHEFLEIAITVGFTGIGIRDRNNATMTRVFHLDNSESRPEAPRPRLWTY